MLWLTSLLFLRVARQAWHYRNHLASFALGLLGSTSVVHHLGTAPAALSRFDRWWAHCCGLGGVLHGIRTRQWHLVPHLVWITVAFYGIECRVPAVWSDVVHGTLHAAAAHAFSALLHSKGGSRGHPGPMPQHEQV